MPEFTALNVSSTAFIELFWAYVLCGSMTTEYWDRHYDTNALSTTIVWC